MLDLDIIGLLNQAHAVRAEAARARRLATQQSDNDTRQIIKHFARDMDARAAELETLSLAIVPVGLRVRIPGDDPD